MRESNKCQVERKGKGMWRLAAFEGSICCSKKNTKHFNPKRTRKITRKTQNKTNQTKKKQNKIIDKKKQIIPHATVAFSSSLREIGIAAHHSKQGLRDNINMLLL